MKPLPPEPDSLRPRMVRSAMVHAIVLLGAAGYSYLQGKVDPFGDPNPMTGGSVMIQPVNSIPIPTPPAPVQPVANDTKSQVPEPPKTKPKPEPKRAKQDDPDAIALRSKKAPPKKKQEPAAAKASKPEPVPKNQVFSETAPRAASPIYTMTGSGGVGLAQGNPFGNRFGYYADLVRQRVARTWQTGAIAATTAPPAVITFDVRRDGSITNVKLVRSSGNGQLDYSCQRAVIEASPLPPLPAGFERDSANIEFWFQLQK